MRAMVLRGNDLTVEDLERPVPGPMQVLARVRACGICGSDLHFARYAEQMLAVTRAADPAGWSAMDLNRGVVMGHEFVAEVVEAGPGAEDWTTGTRVTSVPILLDPAMPRGVHSIGYSSTFPAPAPFSFKNSLYSLTLSCWNISSAPISASLSSGW